MRKIIALLLLTASPVVFATLPPLSPEAKAKAEETAARAAWSAKVGNYQLCESQNKVAAEYYASAQAAGKPTKPPLPTPPCQNPGPFTYAAPDAKPIEAAGAHSPTETAASPPSTTEPAATSAPAGTPAAPPTPATPATPETPAAPK